MTLSPFRLLCGVGVLAIFSSTVSKSPALPLLVSHLGGGPAAIGLVASVSAAAGILFSLPAGILSDRFGRRRMLLAAALILATAPFLYPAAGKVWQLMLVRFYHGLATAIFVPVAMAMVADLYQTGRGEKMGWFSTATLLGRFSAPAIGGGVLGLYGTTDAGFRMVYLLCGAMGTLAALGALLLPGRRAGRAAASVGSAAGWRSGVRQLLADRAIMATCGVEGAILFAYGIFETFLPGIGLAAGLDPSRIGVCLSAQIIAVALSKPGLGRLSDLHGRPPQIVAGALAGAVCIALFALADSFPALLGLSILLGVSISVVTSASAAHIADLSGSGSQGSAMGILGSIMDIGHSSGPLLGGLLAASLGRGASFLGAGAVLTAAAILFAGMSRRR
ncbi:MAG: MFS transporter [Thermodesulfobacteriota bacterium]